MTSNTVTYRFRDIRFLEGQNNGFGDPLRVVPPKGEKICPGPMYQHANFTSISVTVAEISVTGQIHTITADLISDKTHTSFAFLNNKLLLL